MGFLSSSFNIVKCVESCQQLAGQSECSEIERLNEQARVQNLDPYIYSNLFLPIVDKGYITLDDVDFSRFEREDIEKLEYALLYDPFKEIASFGALLDKVKPTAKNSNIFI